MAYEKTFREKPDIGALVLRQLDRKNTVGSMSYEDAVKQALNNLPMDARQAVLENKDKYETEEPMLVYRKFSGRRMGSKTAPVMIDPSRHPRLTDEGEIDWSDPNILSPQLKNIRHTDYALMDALIMDQMEISGLTYSENKRNVVMPKNAFYHFQDKPTPKPKEIPENDGQEKEG